MVTAPEEAEPLLTPAEVAGMFRVDPKTVTRWAKAGKLTSVRTLGGHRRYIAAEVKALLEGIPGQRPDLPVSAATAHAAAAAHAAVPTGRVGLAPLPPPPATPGSSAGLPSSS